MTRAKFACTSKQIAVDSGWDYKEQASTTKEVAHIELYPVTATSAENAEFFKSTPNGKIELHVVNLDAAALFEPGKEYFVDFSEAPIAEAAGAPTTPETPAENAANTAAPDPSQPADALTPPPADPANAQPEGSQAAAQ